MKSEKGITLTSLGIYIVIILIALITLATITAYFRSNVNEFNTQTTVDLEFDKFNLYFIEEVKKTNNKIDETNSTETKISFSSGNTYEFSDNSIMLNGNVKIAEKIEACTFNFSKDENNLQVVTVYIKVGETERTNQYTLSNQTTDIQNDEDYIYGYKRVSGTNELILDNSIKTNLKDYKIYGNSVQDGTPSPTNPVEIQSVGDKTKNLFNFDKIEGQTQGTPNYDDKSILLPSTNNMYTLGQSFTGTPTAFEKFNEVLNIKEPGYYCLMVKVKSDTEDIKTRADWTFNIVTPEETVNIKPTGYTYKNGYLFGKFQFTEEVLDLLKKSANTFRLYMYAFRTTDTLENVDVTISDFMFVKGDYTYNTMPEYELYDKYKIRVTTSGKNLIDLSKTQSGYINKNGLIVNNTLIDATDFIYVEANETYTFSYEYDELAGNSGKIIAFYTDKDDTTYVQSISYMPSVKVFKFTAPITGYVRLCYYNNVYNIQLEKNTEATEYEPNAEAVVSTIYLDEPLRKVGDYADYIDFENQKVVRNIKLGILTTNGTSSVGSNGEDIVKFYYTKFTDRKISTNNEIAVLATGLAPLSYSEYSKTNSSNLQSIAGGISNVAVFFKIGKTLIGGETIEACKTYLTENPITVHYILETPTEELIELPTLSSYKGTTTIRIDTEIPPSNTEVVYYSK